MNIRTIPLLLSVGLILLLSGINCAAPREAQNAPGVEAEKTPAAVTKTHPPSAPAAELPSVADVVEKISPSVVTVIVRTVSQGPRQPIRGSGVGTGIIFDPSGYILTNSHVIADATRVTVILPDERSMEAKIVGRDPFTDLAVIKVEETNLPAASFGSSDQLRIGEWVIAIGNALGLSGGPSVTVGVVSAKGRSVGVPESNIVLHDMVQTDAAINEGNSGGPLVNLQGQVVGISTVMVSDAQGIGFAVGTSTALPIMEQLVKSGRVVWPWLGVSVEEITRARALELNLAVTEGILIRGVEVDTPAQKAGLKAGDIIVELDSQPVKEVRQLQDLIRKHKIGDQVTVTYIRSGSRQTASVTLAEMPRGL